MSGISVVGAHPVIKFQPVTEVPRRKAVVAVAEATHVAQLKNIGHSPAWSQAALALIEAARRTAS